MFAFVALPLEDKDSKDRGDQQPTLPMVFLYQEMMRTTPKGPDRFLCLDRFGSDGSGWFKIPHGGFGPPLRTIQIGGRRLPLQIDGPKTLEILQAYMENGMPGLRPPLFY
jgi:hypothetical protein